MTSQTKCMQLAPGVKKLDWSAQIPNLSTIKHIWGEFPHHLQARSNHPASILNLPRVMWLNGSKPSLNVPLFIGKPFPKSEGIYRDRVELIPS